MLKIDKITAGYGEMPMITDVSLDVRDGALVALIGSNGAGKSTLVKVISALLRPMSGKIFLDGVELTTLQSHEVVEAGVVQVPEGRKLFPAMSIRDNLLIGGRNAQARKHISSSLERTFELFPVLKQRQRQEAGTLSGGEQQMVAVGRALMAMPKVLVFDEPSLGLGPKLVVDLFHTIGQLKQEGMTILLIEQNVMLSLKICDYGYVLENGKIALSGDGNTLLKDERVKTAYLGM